MLIHFIQKSTRKTKQTIQNPVFWFLETCLLESFNQKIKSPWEQNLGTKYRDVDTEMGQNKRERENERIGRRGIVSSNLIKLDFNQHHVFDEWVARRIQKKKQLGRASHRIG